MPGAMNSIMGFKHIQRENKRQASNNSKQVVCTSNEEQKECNHENVRTK